MICIEPAFDPQIAFLDFGRAGMAGLGARVNIDLYLSVMIAHFFEPQRVMNWFESPDSL
jgi:hypothetical protein